MGAKLWNNDLFHSLVKGLDIEDSETRLLYEPPQVDKNGERVVNLNAHFMRKCNKAYANHLYGYLVGTTLPFFQVKHNLTRMWHQYGLITITRNMAGYYFFKFSNEEGMQKVLQKGPWLVNDVPMMLRLWEPDACLEKPDPSMVPIWVSIMDLPLSLWNGGNISQIVSCIGKPLMLDKPTFDRCNKKEGVVSYARVLVNALAQNRLPDKIKVQFPPKIDAPRKVCYFTLSYGLKPPLCTHCNVFGNSNDMCKAKYAKSGTLNGNDVTIDMGDDTLQLKNKNDCLPQVVNDNRIGKNTMENQDGFTRVQRKKKKKKKKKIPIWQPKSIKHLEVGPSNTKEVSLKGREKVQVSNSFEVLNVEDSDNEIDDYWDGEIKLWDSEKVEAQKFVKLKALPARVIYAKWSPQLKDYFASICKEVGLDPTLLEVDRDVYSEEDATARFMS
ncbi:hypothetical protein E3N88_29365 [Mikania micrantha]|uniref:DUF4283 domain-containing protein n=1 Tax=Mikania micrantha TaxID=192012 RepID=A0A5N6MJB5_9ASTR|nr:hypothetical protein E3N88_29365 [Mikania micrantha]